MSTAKWTLTVRAGECERCFVGTSELDPQR